MAPLLPPDLIQRFEREIMPEMDVLHRMALRLTGDADDAADLVQESFLRAMRGFSGFRPDSNARAWLARVVHTAFLDQRRRTTRRREDPWNDELVEEASLGRYVEWEPALLRDAWDDDLEAALSALPPRWRSAVMMVDAEGLSYEEAADALEIPVGTLRSSLHRARQRMVASLTQRDAGDARE